MVAAGSNTTAGENTGVAAGQIVAVKKLILEVESDEFLQVCILHVLLIYEVCVSLCVRVRVCMCVSCVWLKSAIFFTYS